MLLSFIIPVYNNADAFAECIASLRPLLEGGIAEVVAVDDGSQQPLTADADGVRTIRIDHQGAAAARNIGIGNAQGEYLWFVDADDTIDTEGIDSLVEDLRKMPDETAFFHIGPMVTQGSPDEEVQHCRPDATATHLCKPLLLVRPRGTVTDHTTNIIRRSWLAAHPELRYPEGMSLLEDTVFSLRVAETAASCLCNDSYRFYRHHTYHPSLTAGAWSARRSAAFTGDICRFFTFLKDFANRYADTEVPQFYKRMRYVYLRVMAVKGCPWGDIGRLMAVVGPVCCCFMPVYRLFACLCRTLRPKR